jgi:hypothetical protein
MIREGIEMIKLKKHDNEMAHFYEDELYTTVLEEIARGCRNGKKLAQEALKAKKIEFPRWCA